MLSAAVLGRIILSEHDTIRKYNNKTFPKCKVELDCEACDQCRESLSLFRLAWRMRCDATLPAQLDKSEKFRGAAREKFPSAARMTCNMLEGVSLKLKCSDRTLAHQPKIMRTELVLDISAT